MLEFDRSDQQSRRTSNHRQWHRRKILTEPMKVMRLYRIPTQATHVQIKENEELKDRSNSMRTFPKLRHELHFSDIFLDSRKAPYLG